MLGDAAIRPRARLLAGHSPPLGAYDADIVILAFNRLEDTIAAIQSARAQRGATIHVIVLDQGSDPDMLRVLSRHFGSSRHAAIYQTQENLGVAGGRNLATSLGHGRIIVALDNDAVFKTPFVVAGAVRAFSQRPELGAIGFNILCADGERPDRFSWGYPSRLLTRFTEKFETTTFVGAGHAIRRVTWDAVGGYDASFFFTWEEYDFCLAAIALKWSIAYDGSLVVLHKVSMDARIGWSAARTTHFVRNRLLISRKWGSSFFGLVPRMLGYILRGWLSNRLSATMAGIRAAWDAEVPNPKKMPKDMRRYLYVNEARYRGSWIDKLRHELFRQWHTDP
jgi:GT2 family glycosyltransferase